MQEHEFDCPDALWGAFEDTAKQLKYLVPASARRSMEEYIGMLGRCYCNAFEACGTVSALIPRPRHTWMSHAFTLLLQRL